MQDVFYIIKLQVTAPLKLAAVGGQRGETLLVIKTFEFNILDNKIPLT